MARRKTSNNFVAGHWFQLLPIFFLIFIIPFSFNLVNISTFLGSHAQETPTTYTHYDMKVLVIQYFPIAPDGINIDLRVTGDVDRSYSLVKERTEQNTKELKESIEQASRYRGYEDPQATPALSYEIVDTKEHKEAVPFDPITRRPMYYAILNRENICDYVQNKGVSEVWLWAYQGPVYPGRADGQSYLAIYESKMSGPYGDISNSGQENDMPKCGKTYRVYTFNYANRTSYALESWGHQLERELSSVDPTLFSLWQGPAHPFSTKETGRCGSVHNPPNARFEYDWANPKSNQSDCLDWNPNTPGKLTAVDCSIWGCEGDPHLHYMIWNWQNLPGRGNTLKYYGLPLRNWWDIHGDFDKYYGSNRTLTLQGSTLNCFFSGGCDTPTPSAVPTPTTVPDTSRCAQAGGVCADSSGRQTNGEMCKTYLGDELSRSSCSQYYYCWSSCSNGYQTPAVSVPTPKPTLIPFQSTACSQSGGICADSDGVAKDGRKCSSYLGDNLSKSSCEQYYYCWKDCN